MYQPKEFTFTLPIRPKAVQSTRFAHGHSFVDKKTKEWKRDVGALMRPFKPDVPSKMPFEVIRVTSLKDVISKG